MIPGTKPRAAAREAFSAPEKNDTACLEQKKTAEDLELERQKSLELQREPSHRQYSRRELFTNAPALFGEGLTKLLRKSNHFKNQLSEKIPEPEKK